MAMSHLSPGHIQGLPIHCLQMTVMTLFRADISTRTRVVAGQALSLVTASAEHETQQEVLP